MELNFFPEFSYDVQVNVCKLSQACEKYIETSGIARKEDSRSFVKILTLGTDLHTFTYHTGAADADRAAHGGIPPADQLTSFVHTSYIEGSTYATTTQLSSALPARDACSTKHID